MKLFNTAEVFARASGFAGKNSKKLLKEITKLMEKSLKKGISTSKKFAKEVTPDFNKEKQEQGEER